MKTLLFLFILIPMVGLAQPRDMFNPTRQQDPLGLSIDTRREMESANAIPKLMATSNLDITDENRMFLDSFHQAGFDPRTHASIVWKEYYKYDKMGKQVLLTKYATFEKYPRRIESIYDEKGRCISESNSIWNSETKQWVKISEIIDSYNPEGTLISIAENAWNDNGKREFSAKTKLDFDKQGHILLMTLSLQDTTNQWMENLKTEYAYTDNNHILSTDYLWNKGNNHWVNVSKYENEYDAYGNVILAVENKWDSLTNQWIGVTKHMRTYTPKGKLTGYTDQVWNSVKKQWDNVQKSDYSLNSKGNMILRIEYHWDTASNQWIDFKRTEYSYDNNENMLLYIESSLKPIKRGTLFKHEYIYDDKGLRTSAIDYKWNQSDSTWNSLMKVDYGYDANGNWTKTNMFRRNKDNSGWELSTQCDFYYSHPALSEK